mmetsp:Transcript_3488/g.12391  ORF Transcript_3488/g.12391 Transcript_3488/m.12391 type:complete len:277 (-) Transcript_3488:61-891(-)
MSPCHVRGGLVTCWAATNHEHLVVHCTRLLQELPVERTRGHVESARIHHDFGTTSSGDGGQLWEPHVVADPDAELSCRRVHHRGVLARRERVGFAHGDLSWDVDVEQVHFSMLGQARPIWTVHATRVVELAAMRFGNGSADDRHLVLGSCGGQHLRRRRSASFDVFCIHWKAGVGVWTIPHLRQHHHLRTVRRSFGDRLACMRHVRLLIGRHAQLTHRHAHLFHAPRCCRRHGLHRDQWHGAVPSARPSSMASTSTCQDAAMNAFTRVSVHIQDDG